METTDKIKTIQLLLGIEPDGLWGPASQNAFESLVHAQAIERETGKGLGWHNVKASSFADPADVRAFRKCKTQGKSDHECFKVGDNGIGCWGDDTSQGSGPSVALPPDDMIERWGSVAKAKHAQVEVMVGGDRCMTILKDRMPWKKNIKNGAGIDLNPDTCAALGLKPPMSTKAQWRWI